MGFLTPKSKLQNFFYKKTKKTPKQHSNICSHIYSRGQSSTAKCRQKTHTGWFSKNAFKLTPHRTKGELINETSSFYSINNLHYKQLACGITFTTQFDLSGISPHSAFFCIF